jgi:endonuclease/exonuclease/phosphatase family metal-dependent hydrolase
MPLQGADTTPVLVRAITWNLFHGRDAPPDPSLFTWRSRLLKITERGAEYAQVNRNLFAEFATALSSMAWDVALLQESPPRWAPRLAESLGAETHMALTSRNWLPWLQGPIADFNPDLIASSEGGSNLTLLRGAQLGGADGPISERRELVINEGRPERRVMACTRTAAGLCVANLHASTTQTGLAPSEVLRAAESAVEWAGASPLLFGGDLNLRPAQHPEVFERLRDLHGLERPTAPGEIDHLLVRGIQVIELPTELPHPEVVRDPDFRGPLGLWRREAGRRIRLSDHAPVGAAYEIAAASD